MTTTVETGIAHKVTVVKHTHGSANLHVHDTDMDKEIYTHLDKEDAEKVGLTLLGESATVITDLPEVTVDADLWATASGYSRSVNQDGEDLLENAKALLAIHAFIVKRNEEQEEAKKAEAEAEAEAVKAKEAAKAKRRDELASKFSARFSTFADLGTSGRNAINYIIELEEAAKVS